MSARFTLCFRCRLRARLARLGANRGAQDLSVDGAVTLPPPPWPTARPRVTVGDGGRPQWRSPIQLRGDGTGPHTMENSFKKAFTARTFRIASGEMEKRLKDNPQMGAQYLTGFTTGRGALPIKIGDEVVGAAGASGAPGGEKDEACVQTGIDKVKDQLK